MTGQINTGNGIYANHGTAILDRAQRERRPLTPSEERDVNLAADVAELRNTTRGLKDRVASLEKRRPSATRIDLGPNPHRPFSSLGQFLRVVMDRARIPVEDPRFDAVRIAATGLNETVSSDGGFVVQ